MSQLLTIQEVAGILRVSPKQVRRLKIPCVHIGRLVRFSLADVTRFVEARTFNA